MSTSIRDASRWVIGAAKFRQLTIAQHPKDDQASMTEDSIAALMDDPKFGATMRGAIGKMLDNERTYLRNTPTYALATERVLETRALDLDALKRSGTAQLVFMEFQGAAKRGDAHAMERIADSMKEAVKAIEGIRGPTAERQTMLQHLRDQCEIAAGGDSGLVASVLQTAQTAYLDELYERMEPYTQPALERSEDFDFTA